MKGGEILLLGLMDYKNSLVKKMLNQDRIDPGSFSFLESGWWALHAAAITGIFALGHQMAKKESRYHKK